MNKFFCTGKHSDGSDVTAEITDLSTFINASPNDFIVVECDDVYHQVKKGEVQWGDIQKVEPLNF